MINRIAPGTPSFLSRPGKAGASSRKESLFWHQYPAQKPTEIERWKTFLIAYPNPRFYRSKFANERINNGIPPYDYDVSTWTGAEFADTRNIKFWARIPAATEVIK